MIKRALISVSDKSGIVEFAEKLEKLDVEIISTGGTYKLLKDKGINVVSISDVTKFPECLDGRVKTLHPSIHGGILAIRNNPNHMDKIEELGIKEIDLVVINLYPFKETIAKENVELQEAIENIDIGGPTMLRAAAKNYQDVAVVIEPTQYDDIIADLNNNGEISLEKKFNLAYKVFEHTSHYDTLIAEFLRKKMDKDYIPETLTLTYEKVQDMRYGENPHQDAAFYKEVGANKGLITAAKKLHGKELSYNNINDTNGALELLKEFEEPTVVAVKHSVPCGVGSAADIASAYIKAYEADPVSIFGGIIALNREVDAKTAEEINKIFVEIVIAPSFSKEGFEILAKKKNVRILELEGISNKVPEDTFDMKKVCGGLLVQKYNHKFVNNEEMKNVTKVEADNSSLEDLMFAMKVVKHSKSNAIVIVKNKMTLGIGSGQTSRITAAKIAFDYAKEESKGGVLASDAFFPFSDCVELAAKNGIKSIIQPGGSKKDQDSIDACDKHGISMIMTGIRHFKH